MYEYYNYEDRAEMARQEEIKRREQEKAKAEKKAKRRKWLSTIAMAVVFGLIAGGIFISVNYVNDRFFGNRTEQIAQTSPSDRESKKEKEIGQTEKAEEADEAGDAAKSEDNEQKEPAQINKSQGVYSEQVSQADGTVNSVSAVAKEAMPSIVAITNKSLQEVQMMFSFETRLFESESEGSGIIVSQNDDELLILTNNHVVDGAQTLTVQFFDDEAYEAQVKGTDPSMDVAVIAVPLSDLKSSTKDAIKIALIGDSDKLEIGEQVVAIGNALGYGQSVTTGIISALNRDIDMSNLDNSLIQTDAAINPGNSGGALLNMRGEVIGINSAKLSDMTVEGMCYAIPISKALPVAEQLMNRENRDKVEEDEMGYMGIKGVLVTEDQAELYSMPEGIYLQEIVEDSPAEEAGLQVGDIIEKFDGLRISTYAELQKQMQYYRAGETVELEIYRLRDGRYEEQTISITLGKRMEQN
ncbi:MAG: trypsin-like peptidase domain-containing protein [Lachnospiraceae bacterium]|nr:trypsin-like peptidase domain-containing protein [Lachnospiraceae bacterium]